MMLTLPIQMLPFAAGRHGSSRTSQGCSKFLKVSLLTAACDSQPSGNLSPFVPGWEENNLHEQNGRLVVQMTQKPEFISGLLKSQWNSSSGHWGWAVIQFLNDLELLCAAPASVFNKYVIKLFPASEEIFTEKIISKTCSEYGLELFHMQANSMKRNKIMELEEMAGNIIKGTRIFACLALPQSFSKESYSFISKYSQILMFLHKTNQAHPPSSLQSSWKSDVWERTKKAFPSFADGSLWRDVMLTKWSACPTVTLLLCCLIFSHIVQAAVVETFTPMNSRAKWMF